MKKGIGIIILVLIFSWLVAEQIDLNEATLEEIKKLPITEKQAEDIYNYRFYIDYFSSIYDLREIPSLDQRTLLKLKPLVKISHYEPDDEAAQRREEIYYLIERLGSNEGLQEGISDVWEDYLITPRNLNYLNFEEIRNMPNVSPIDAAAILKRLALNDTIADYRDLRNTTGISYYGASNLRHYVYYKEKPHEKRLYIDYQLKYNDTPYREEPEEMYKTTELEVEVDSTTSYITNLWQKYHMEETEPEVMNKIRARYGNQWKAGVVYSNKKGGTNLLEADMDTFKRNGKYFLGYQKRFNGNNSLKVFAGNYRVTFGEGLVMENTDFYSSRKTGFGFSKTIKGVIGDLSRTKEYALHGAAAEWRSPKFNAAMFISSDYKDAVVYDSNGDGLFTDDDNMLAYLTQTRSFDSDIFEESNYTMAPEEDAFQENIIGGHLAYSPIIGSSIGVSAYEATYDRDFVVYGPDSLRYLLMPDPADAEGKYKMMDSEIAALYSTKTDTYDRNYRRVYGFDWRTVLNNTSIQGEYAELEVDGNMWKLGDDPKALVLSSYTQFDNLYLLSLYRNYDLNFDNPYSRGFSEHQKFEDTAFDKYGHTLANPLMRDLYINSAQAQAEEGVYFETRYQFNRMLTLNRTYVDIWERKADGRKSVRFQGELDFRPIYDLSFRLKYKHQTNRYDDDADRGVSKTNETTGKIRAYLSNFDLLELEYRYLNVWQPPYTYLTNDPEPGGDTIAQGSMLSHADYICVDYTHHFNDNLKVQGSFIYWDGNGVSHWDWEDVEIDFMGEGGTKLWFSLHDKISNNLYLTLKYKTKRYKTQEVEWRAWWNELPESGEYYFKTVDKTENAIRLQLDWKF